MFYHLYEMNHAMMQPWRAAVDATKLAYQHPMNPVSKTQVGRSVAAWCEVVERATRRYAKPTFDLPYTTIGDEEVRITERVVWERPFAKLLNFQRETKADTSDHPRILIVAPMSGHYATLLRGTVERFISDANVYITDWTDARDVPVTDGNFDLDDYIDYVIAMLDFLGPNTHVVGVCQPSVPVLAAVALMENRGDKNAPSSMTLMGGPIDTRISPTAVNKLAEEKPIEWFRDNVIMTVPFPNAGFGRRVYPGFLQLAGFMSMNLDRHMIAKKEFFLHLVRDDGDSAEKHRDFYDEYLAVMDLTAEFYLQTVQTVFIDHSLPERAMYHRGEFVDTSAIKNVAMLTIEGENDDITGNGQTYAAHALCDQLPDAKKRHWEQPKVGHYGVFNGSRFRNEVAPRILEFMRTFDKEIETPKLRSAA
ncbi:MAG: polyhydroxyalkanoate depolymerase [Pseudomonadota bacterium]